VVRHPVYPREIGALCRARHRCPSVLDLVVLGVLVAAQLIRSCSPPRTRDDQRRSESRRQRPHPQERRYPREHVVLAAVVAGLKAAEISKDLWVSEHSVKFHLTNIYRKLGVTNRAGAIGHALASGIVAVPAERAAA